MLTVSPLIYQLSSLCCVVSLVSENPFRPVSDRLIHDTVETPIMLASLCIVSVLSKPYASERGCLNVFETPLIHLTFLYCFETFSEISKAKSQDFYKPHWLMNPSPIEQEDPESEGEVAEEREVEATPEMFLCSFCLQVSFTDKVG